MLALALALASAVSYGASDFLGGLLSSRSSPRAIAVVAQLTGGLVVGIFALSLGVTMPGSAWGWTAAAALGTALGVVLLYRGLSRGRMSVVAPLSGIGAAMLPVIVGLIDGERPGVWAAVGLVAALPAILLVAHVRDTGTGSSGWADGAFAGLGFGVSFLAVARLPHGAELGGLALIQLTAALLVSLTLVRGGRRAFILPTPHVFGAAAVGLLSALALLSFQIASHHGYLSETIVLASLYPAATIVLALVVLHERVNAIQMAGFALCAASIGLIVSG